MTKPGPIATPIDLRANETLVASTGVDVPSYERALLQPGIVHVGVGGFHRAHLAAYVDDLARAGSCNWSITGVGLLPSDEAMASALLPQLGRYALITRSATGSSVRVIGSIVDFVHTDGSAEGRSEIVNLMSSADTRIVSLTITEGAYPITDSGDFDAAAPSAQADGAFAIIVDALEQRMTAGLPPFTVMSCDNIVGNGNVARKATLGVAAANPELHDWIEVNGAFPNGMVDRITPVTTDEDRMWLAQEIGVADAWPVVTEPFRQWVLEDNFSCGRPAFEDVGVILTDNVEPFEILKLRLLNAGHSTLAYVAALAGIDFVDQVMEDDLFNAYFHAFVNNEAIPVLPEVPGIDPHEYRDALVERFSNPAIGDQISRLCLDGSSKFPKFLLPTVRLQLQARANVELSALALAGWCRYLQGIDDAGNTIDASFDPILDQLKAAAAAAATDPSAFLQIESVFGTDLAADDRFSEPFATALQSLTENGVRTTLSTALTTST